MSEVKEATSISDVANYLATEIASSKIYDRQDIYVKIKTSLALLLDNAPNSAKFEKLKAENEKFRKDLHKTSQESLFWRKKLREIIGEEAMKPLYEEVNNIQ